MWAVSVSVVLPGAIPRAMFAPGPHSPCISASGSVPPDQISALDLFRGSITKHPLIAGRNDRLATSYQIGFSDYEWPQSVPVRFSGATIDQEYLLEGAIARLRHLGHQHADIAMFLDKAEFLLFQEIDGKKLPRSPGMFRSRRNSARSRTSQEVSSSGCGSSTK